MGAGSANCSVVARFPGLWWAHTPVGVKRVESLGDFDMVGRRGWEWGTAELAGASNEESNDAAKVSCRPGVWSGVGATLCRDAMQRTTYVLVRLLICRNWGYWSATSSCIRVEMEMMKSLVGFES